MREPRRGFYVEGKYRKSFENHRKVKYQNEGRDELISYFGKFLALVFLQIRYQNWKNEIVFGIFR